MTRLPIFSASKVRRQDLLILFGLACLIRLLTAWPQQQPNYMDAAYSYVNALNLLAGRGFVEDFVWNYLDQPGLPPQPSHLYWMPLTSILAWFGMALGGASYRAAQMPFVLLSALLAPLSYMTAFWLSGQRRLGWLAGWLAIFSGFYVPFWTAIDNFTPFAITGSLALLTAWLGMGEAGSREYGVGNKKYRGVLTSLSTPPTRSVKMSLRGRKAEAISISAGETASPAARSDMNQVIFLGEQFALYSLLWLFAAGIFTGLAHLARADGPLLLIAILLLYILRFTIYDLRLTPHASRLLFLLLGYFVVMAPWFIRNWQMTGTFLPIAGSQTIWLNSYDELFSYGRELSARTLLAQGLGPALEGRWWALTINLQTVLAVWGLIFLTPLALLGGWYLRRHALVQLTGLYAVLLFGAMTLVFAFPGARGGLFHSGAALLPFIYSTALVGLEQAVEWIAARRCHWNAAAAKQVFGLGLVVMAFSLSNFIYYRQVLRNNAWNSADALYPTIAAWVAQTNPSATVMIGNPPAYRYHGGGLSVIVPNETIETTLTAAHHYKADYLILDHNHPAPLTEIYTATVTHPSLSLVQIFTDASGQPIYIFKINHP